MKPLFALEALVAILLGGFMNNSSEQQVSVLSSVIIRNLLFLTGALSFSLVAMSYEVLFAAIIVCSNCDCTDSLNDRPGSYLHCRRSLFAASQPYRYLCPAQERVRPRRGDRLFIRDAI